MTRHPVPPMLRAIADYIDPAAFDSLPEADAAAIRLLAEHYFEDSATSTAVRKHVESLANDDVQKALRVLNDADEDLMVPLLLVCSEFALQLGASLAYRLMTGKDGGR